MATDSTMTSLASTLSSEETLPSTNALTTLTTPTSTTIDPMLIALYSIAGVLGLLVIVFVVAIILFCCWQSRLKLDKVVNEPAATTTDPEDAFNQYRGTAQERQQQDILLATIPPPLARPSIYRRSRRDDNGPGYGPGNREQETAVDSVAVLPPAEEARLVSSGILLDRPGQTYPRPVVQPAYATNKVLTTNHVPPGVYSGPRSASEAGGYAPAQISRAPSYRSNPQQHVSSPGGYYEPAPLNIPRVNAIPRARSDGAPATDFRDMSMAPEPYYSGEGVGDLSQGPAPRGAPIRLSRRSLDPARAPARGSNLYQDLPDQDMHGQQSFPPTVPASSTTIPAWMNNQLLTSRMTTANGGAYTQTTGGY